MDAPDGPGGRQVVGGDADAVPDVVPLDLGGPDTTPDSALDGSVDAGATNPARLWLVGPESDIHLGDVEPLTPF